MAKPFRTMIMVWCWTVVVFGIVLMGGTFTGTDGPTRQLLAILGDGVPEMNAPLRFGIGLMGAVTFGWGLTMLAVASVSHLIDPAAGRLLWRRIALAVCAWYVVDSAISIATGFALNAASNTVFLGAFLAILWQGGVFASSSASIGGPVATG